MDRFDLPGGGGGDGGDGRTRQSAGEQTKFHPGEASVVLGMFHPIHLYRDNKPI